MRLGFFGGSFDPPHRGHVAIAKAAADAFRLEEVLIAPTGRQPLKPDGPRASYADRLAMVTLISEIDPRFTASGLDAPRADGGLNYTVDALSALKESWPDAEVYTVIGADSFLEFRRWREAHRLLEMSEWIVVSRPGFALSQSDGAAWPREERERAHRLETVMEDVSASDIRRRLALGDPCNGLISAQVQEYIAKRGLYGFRQA